MSLPPLTDAELVIGIVGRIGTDTSALAKLTSEILYNLRYKTKIIKITKSLSGASLETKIDDSNTEARYESYIKACNEIRKKAKSNEIFCLYAISEIHDHRKIEKGSTSDPIERQAYIIDQLKRPEEVLVLKQIYGEQFVLISAHMPYEKRVEVLSKKMAEEHHDSPKSESWKEKARNLISIDDNESDEPFGQRVSDIFHQADIIVDFSNLKYSKNILDRFFRLIFGDFTVSPTPDEFFQYLSASVALTSCDTARQVGAVIENDRDVISTGYNEAPKFGGATYWPDDGNDGRDISYGRDYNTIRKNQMVIDIVEKLRAAKKLIPDYATLSKNEIESIMLYSKDAILKDAQILDTLEYGRAVHAEMAAITTAARRGASIKNATLYCTTFPCHNCAKHIISSGISEVVYLEPYPKSYAFELYPDSVLIDPIDKSNYHVVFRQFVGITPNRYKDAFSKHKNKDQKGYTINWTASDASPSIRSVVQNHTDREILFLNHIKSELPETANKIFK